MTEQSNTEQKIMEAAEAVFLEEGFAGARMQHIADKAGINKAMLHYYFRSKDKLFELVFNHKIKEFVPQITSALHDDSIPFIEKIDHFIVAYLEKLRQNPRLPLFIITTMNRNPDLSKLIKHPLGQEIKATMEAAIDKGNIRAVDPHQFMLTLIGMCIFPFLARPIFRSINALSDKEYNQILAERHLHVMQYARAILTKDG